MTSTETRKKAYRYGMTAEKFAAAYLTCKAYRVLAERYRNHQGEIDIVACKGRMLVAVEVKARQSFKDCEEVVTAGKQQKISRAVEGLIGGQGKISGLTSAHTRNIRFDVIWMAPWRWPLHIKDAWRL